MTSFVEKIKDKVTGDSTPSGQHLAAILPAKGTPLEVQHRATPTPGPDEILLEVRSIAFNPIDVYMRDFGFALEHFPTVVGSDVSGIISAVGSSVTAPELQPGARVAGFAPCFFTKGVADYGAFQARTLLPAAYVVPLPANVSFNEGAVLPMAVVTTWSGWYSIGVPRDTAYTPADKKGMLVWGATSSVGSAAVQVARSLGFVVYATASERHHEYVKSLGASKVFDYKNEGVVEEIVKTAKEIGVKLNTGYDAVGQLKSSMAVLKEFSNGKAKVASAAPLPQDLARVEGVEVKFVMAPDGDKEREEHFHFVFRVWLKEKLEKGDFVPSPKVKVVGKGLEFAQKALDELKNGVSGTKLVIEI